MVDNSVYEDIAARCNGAVTVGVTEVGTSTGLAERIAAVFGEDNVKVKVTNSAEKADFGIVVYAGGGGAPLEKAISGYKTAHKPCVVALNATDKDGAALKVELENKYSVAVVVISAEASGEDISKILNAVLFEFPVTSLDINIPDWMCYLSPESSALSELISRIRTVAPKISKMKDISSFDGVLEGCDFWQGTPSIKSNLADGRAEITLTAKEGIYFNMLSEIAGDSIGDECSLMRFVRSASDAKRSYDKIKDAFECAKVNGYGIVEPDDADMSLDKPQVVRQGGSVGIKLKATAPSYHIVKVEVTGEVSPIMGSAKQSEGIVEGMMNGFETNPDGMWETNVFGKSLRGMVKEGLSGKVCGMHDETKTKMRRAISRIVNEGKGGVICILL